MNSQNQYTHFTTSNGLTHDITYGLFQDKNGFIWIGTDNGVVKFDGFDFISFTVDQGLNNNYVIDINQDSEGRILLATWGGGLNFFNAEAVNQSLQHPLEVDKISYLFNWKSSFVAPSSTSNYFSVFSYEDFNYKQSLYYINTLNNDFSISSKNNKKSKDINVWTSVVNDSLFIHHSPLERENKQSVYGIYLFDNSLKLIWKFLKDEKITHIHSLNSKTKLAFSENEIIYFNNSGIIKKEHLPFIQNTEVIKVHILQNDNFLITASDSKGFRNVFIYNSKSRAVLNFEKELKINVPISDALEDHEGNIWISTYGQGVFCYFKINNDFKYINSKASKSVNYIDVVEHNDTILALTNDKIIKIKHDSIFSETKLNGLAKSINVINSKTYVSSLNINKPKIVLSKNVVEVYGYKLIHDDSIGLIKVLNNKLEINGQRFVIDKKVDINDAIYFDEYLYIATNLGLLKYAYPEFDLIKSYDKSDGLISSNLRDLEFIKDVLWIATDKGLNSLNKKGEFKSFTVLDGLVDNNLTTLCLDHKNQLWIGSQKGVSIYSDGTFNNLSIDNGLLSAYINRIFESKKNEVYVASNKGLTIINNSMPLEITDPPILNITNDEYKFRVNPITFNRSKAISVQFSLNNNEWKEILNNEVLDFSEYKQGDYKIIFRSKKIDSDWVYSKEYNFNIKLPWFKNLWLISALTLLLSGIVLILIYNQLKKIKRKNLQLSRAINKQLLLEKRLTNVRQNIAQDFHDELGNIVAGISITTDRIKRNITKKSLKEIKGQINKVHQESNKLYSGIRDFIWAIDSDNDSISHLISYLTDYGRDVFDIDVIDFQVSNKIENNDLKLPYYWNKQLLLMFKEAFMNSLKHAKPTKTALIFELKNDMLTIIYKDNGSGFDINKVSRKSGLKHMLNRAEKIGCELQIESSPHSSTKIIFKGLIND